MNDLTYIRLKFEQQRYPYITSYTSWKVKGPFSIMELTAVHKIVLACHAKINVTFEESDTIPEGDLTPVDNAFTSTGIFIPSNEL